MGDEVRVIEKCGVEPPYGSLPPPTTTLPLTYFDVLYLHSLPIKRIFLYNFPHPTHHFLQTTLPTLKHSLSLTLQHFFPYASNLIIPPNSHPYIRYLHGDSLPLTVAESPADFHLLVSDSQDVANWLPLVPTLSPPRTEDDGTRVVPLMSIQLTLLPNTGFSISLTFHHAVSDGKSLHHFIKYWASLFKANGNILHLPITTTLPCHERHKVKDPKDLKLLYLEQLPPPRNSVSNVHDGVNAKINKVVRGTVVLSREQVEKLKKWVTMALTCNGYKPHVSTFVVTCSLIWISMLKSIETRRDNDENDDEKLSYFIFGADCRGHPQLTIPSNYFGNCLAGMIVSAKRNELVGTTNNNGLVVAANAIERNIKDFKNDALNGAETLMSRLREMRQSNSTIVTVSGSPKLCVYDTDFGWGKPIKTDSVHLDRSGHISLSDSRDSEGAIEVGLVLENTEMTTFINILQQQLHNIVLTAST